MVLLRVMPARWYDVGRIPCACETLRSTLKHRFLELAFVVVDETTWGWLIQHVAREFADGRTLSKTSTKSLASDAVSVGGLYEDCSICDAALTTKGMRRDSILSLERSSSVTG